MSDERRLAILRAIVQDYVHTSEPVGSKALIDRHQLGVSAATVRADMAVLEDEGLIAAPHTSAGRIPTDAGYRAFVNAMTSIRPLSNSERGAIAEFLDGAADLDEVIARTSRLLAALTRQVAVVQYPSLGASTLRRLELVSMGVDEQGAGRIMVVLVASTGRVEQRLVTVPAPSSLEGARADEHWEELTHTAGLALNESAVGLGLAEAIAALRRVEDERVPVSLIEAVTGVFAEALAGERETRVSLAGTSHLAQDPRDFPMSLGPVLDALEQQVVLLRLLSDSAIDEEQGRPVAVRIGAENPIIGLHSTSTVLAPYDSGDKSAGTIAVLGPTRMDYAHTMAQARAVASYLSRILA